MTFKTVSQVKKAIPARTRLEVLRIEAGLNMRDLGKFAGVGTATVCRVEKGKAPDIRTALRLAKFFETSVEDLFHEFF